MSFRAPFTTTPKANLGGAIERFSSRQEPQGENGCRELQEESSNVGESTESARTPRGRAIRCGSRLSGALLAFMLAACAKNEPDASLTHASGGVLGQGGLVGSGGTATTSPGSMGGRLGQGG